MFVIQSDLRISNGQIKGQIPKYIFIQMSTNIMCNTPFYLILTGESIYGAVYYFGDSITTSADKKEIPRSNGKKYHFNGKTLILRSSDQNRICNK